MKKRVNCMFLLPTELTGYGHDVCQIFGECVEMNRIVDRCVACTKHTPVSRKALAEAIEIRRAEREKTSPLTPQSEI